jgi:hypothetical protein
VRLEASILTESDLELPGLPMIRMGILFIRHTNVVKIFYFKAWLIAMSCGRLLMQFINLICSPIIIF